MSGTLQGRRIAGLYFSGTEIRDLLVAWLALGVAFTFFFVNGTAGFDRLLAAGIVPPLLVGLLTAGVAFLLHGSPTRSSRSTTTRSPSSGRTTACCFWP